MANITLLIMKGLQSKKQTSTKHNTHINNLPQDMMKLQRRVLSHISLRNPPKLFNVFFFFSIQRLSFFGF